MQSRSNAIAGQRYGLMLVPQLNACVSVHALQLKGGTFANKTKGRTVSVADLIRVGEPEAGFVTVRADEMATEISGSGTIALYGLLFETARAERQAAEAFPLRGVTHPVAGQHRPHAFPSARRIRAAHP